MNVYLIDKKETFSEKKFLFFLNKIINEYNVKISLDEINFLDKFYNYIQEENTKKELSLNDILDKLAEFIVKNKLFKRNEEFFKLVKAFILCSASEKNI